MKVHTGLALLFWACALNLLSGQPLLAAEPADAAILLRTFRDNTAGTQTLTAQFRQQKTMALMAETLEAQGRMCVRQSPQGVALLWEYTSPSVSGFVYEENGVLWLWMRERAAIRPASDGESGLLRAMSDQIISWLRIDPESLARQYHLELLPAESAALPQGVGLTPKRGNAFFSRLEVRFDPAVTRLHSLRLVEKEGDATLLVFSEEARNAPLPDFCRP